MGVQGKTAEDERINLPHSSELAAAAKGVNLAINLPMATQIRGVSVSSWKDSMMQLVFCKGSIVSESCPFKSRLARAAI